MQQMTFLYTALGVFDKTTSSNWDNYMKWIKLPHVTEVVSLDGMLNEPLVEPDYSQADDWNYIYCTERWETGFFTSEAYVLRKRKNVDTFNLLSLVISPDQDCKSVVVDNYEFMGYELLDNEFGVSVLTNCDGFNEPILPTDINKYGLVDEYLTAYEIKKRLLANNPTHPHADTLVIAVWRHKRIGRKK
ncbi:hypothetical protein [Spirosoma sp. KNUC1025]|uniref:hypothetical protein n=1 Tax=Spirosoma sp. KNUC1025 TaxID=2894082 RepID=UPI003870EA5F|nr:hypothetical protein LN737_09865 [Spirosoma sp. KNUC1025]